MKIVVTGGAGFIGANLCRHFVDVFPDAEVVAFDDLSTGSESNLDGSGARLVVGSILDLEALKDGCDNADAIVHLAARPSVPRSIVDPMASHEVNATGTVQLLKVAHELGDPFVIVASSSSVYGANPIIPKVESLLPMPMSPYAVSKLATEQYALAWQHSFGLRTLAFRFFNVFGPLQAAGHAYAAAIPAFVSAALAGDEVFVNGDGLQTRDFTYVGTVCAVIAEAVRVNSPYPSPVNLAFGSRISLLDVIANLQSILSLSIKVRYREPRAGDVAHSQADGSLVREMFPAVTPVDFVDGLRSTVEWAEAQRS